MEILETSALGSPTDAGYAMPAEWERHERCWMAWPDRTDHWGEEHLAETQQAFAAVARAIRAFEPLTMVANTQSAETARSLCGPEIDVVTIPIDDAWLRDSGPSFLRRADGAVAGVAWRFNAWGGKSRYGRDAQLAQAVLNRAGAPAYHASLCLEGGGIHCDGEGTVITTESVVLNSNRNPGITKADAEEELCRALGANKVIWLPGDPEGLTGDITDGHIDGLVSFVKPGVVLFESDPTATGALRDLVEINRAALERAKDAKGRALDIIPLDDAYEVESDEPHFACSYVNFYIANGGIVMPKFGVPGDERAREVIARAYPDRQVVQVDVTSIAPGGGGIHCITQQQPAARA